MSFFTRLRELALDLVFPAECLGCGGVTHEAPWCERCNTRIDALPFLYCPGCGKRAPEGLSCDACRAKTGLYGLVAAYSYDLKPVREAILQFKYHGVSAYAAQLTQSIINVFSAHTPPLPSFAPERAVVVPIPLARDRFKQRGFNQAELIARNLSAALELPAVSHALVRTKKTKPQVEMPDHQARRDNVAGAFLARDVTLIKGKIVLLVDDVFTTGATMSECAKTLRRAGARAVWGVVIAKG